MVEWKDGVDYLKVELDEIHHGRLTGNIGRLPLLCDAIGICATGDCRRSCLPRVIAVLGMT